MNKPRSARSFAAVIALLALYGGLASAQATRTWVSGVGDDANPCSRTAPCKTFAGAISKTAAGGEINAIDPGGYGAVTITKAITIDGGGTMSSILASGTNGVIVNAGPNDVITLRNLSINGAGNGLNGIRFLAGGALHIDSVVVFGFGNGGGTNGAGLDFFPAGAARLTINNSVFRNNQNYGLLLRPASAAVNATITNSLMDRNGRGVLATDLMSLAVADSVASNNLISGFQIFSAAQPATITLERTTVSGNASFGVRTDGVNALVRLSNSTLTGNGEGISVGGGNVASLQNNTVSGNGVDGAPTQIVPQK